MHRLVKPFILGAIASLWTSAAFAGWTLGADLRGYPWTDSDGQKLQLSAMQAPVIVMTMAYTACRKVWFDSFAVAIRPSSSGSL